MLQKHAGIQGTAPPSRRCRRNFVFLAGFSFHFSYSNIFWVKTVCLSHLSLSLSEETFEEFNKGFYFWVTQFISRIKRVWVLGLDEPKPRSAGTAPCTWMWARVRLPAQPQGASLCPCWAWPPMGPPSPQRWRAAVGNAVIKAGIEIPKWCSWVKAWILLKFPGKRWRKVLVFLRTVTNHSEGEF